MIEIIIVTVTEDPTTITKGIVRSVTLEEEEVTAEEVLREEMDHLTTTEETTEGIIGIETEIEETIGTEELTEKESSRRNQLLNQSLLKSSRHLN